MIEKAKILLQFASAPLSIAAIFISLLSYRAQSLQYEELHKEQITVIQTGAATNHTTQYEIGICGPESSMFSVDYQVFVSNNSADPVSVIDYSILNSAKKGHYLISGGRTTDAIIGTSFPLNIPGKTSVILNIRVWYEIAESCDKILRSKYRHGRSIVFRDFLRTCYLQRLDPFGGSVEYREFEKDGRLITFNGYKEMPVKILQFTTSKGTSAIESLTFVPKNE